MRKTLLIGPALAVLCFAACSDSDTPASSAFTDLNPAWLLTPEEATAWASVKNDNLPTLTDSPEWLNYLSFLEEKLSEYGAVDF